MSCYSKDSILMANSDQAPDYLTALLIATVIVKILTVVIDWRQLRKYTEIKPEQYLESLVSVEEFLQS